MEVFPRITIEPGKCDGKACVRGLRITVEHVLAMLAEGLSAEQIVTEWPMLEREDIRAVLNYAAHLAGERNLPPAT